MPNIVEQILGPLGDHSPSPDPGDQTGLYLRASNGNTCTITKNQAQAFYQGTTGNAQSRHDQTVAWAVNTIVTALGTEMVGAAQLTIDFNAATGDLSTLRITG